MCEIRAEISICRYMQRYSDIHKNDVCDSIGGRETV